MRLLNASDEVFKGLGRGFWRPWKRLLKALEEAFKGFGGSF
jgi:hypothetical protein